MLELRNIVVDTDDGKRILNGLSLDVAGNRLVAVTGPNGGGKSTLGRVVMGIIKPTSGSVVWNGEDITNMSITDRAKLGIALAFQQPVRFKGIGVRDMIELATGNKLDEATLCEYLGAVGLCGCDYVDRQIDASLSGGEIKRIEIASIMARGAKLSIFDEPEAGIDLWSFQNLLEVFRKIRADLGGTIIIISHQERILDIADEIVVVANGAITARGVPGDILPRLLSNEDRCDLCPKGIEFTQYGELGGATA